MNTQFNIIPSKIGQLVDARSLHEKLGSKQKFADWIKSRIEEYGFEANQDYLINEVFPKSMKNPQGGRPKTEYHLTLDMAKELCMLERTPIGRQFRQYFIQAEKELVQMRAITHKSPIQINGVQYLPYRMFLHNINPTRKSDGGTDHDKIRKYPNHFLKINGLQYVSEEMQAYIIRNKTHYKETIQKINLLSKYNQPYLFNLLNN